MKSVEMLDFEIQIAEKNSRLGGEYADVHADCLRWVRENGQEFMGFDRAGSAKLAEFRTPEEKACYHNTLLARDYRDQSLLYYEGWCDFGIGLPMHHAWNVRDGVVLDVTLSLPFWDDKDASAISYFGVEVPYDWAWEQVPKAGMGRDAMTSGPFMFDWAHSQCQQDSVVAE